MPQSRTVVHNVIVWSTTSSLAVPGPMAFQNASTAQEVTPTATDFEFQVLGRIFHRSLQHLPPKQRWGDPSPMPPSLLPLIPGLTDIPEDPVPDGDQPKPTPPPILSFKPLPSQPSRSALILDQFSIHCPVQYCSNKHLLSTTIVMGRCFFDFVAPRSDKIVRSWIDVIKAWGVNGRGQPSDGMLCWQRSATEAPPPLMPEGLFFIYAVFLRNVISLVPYQCSTFYFANLSNGARQRCTFAHSSFVIANLESIFGTLLLVHEQQGPGLPEGSLVASPKGLWNAM